MFVGVPRETFPGENRVALTPSEVKKLVNAGIEVIVEAGAGERAGFSDHLYMESGAKIGNREEVFSKSEILLKVRGLLADEENFKLEHELYRNKTIIGFLEPFEIKKILDVVKDLRLTAFSMELIPRTTRAQSMDALSSMATVAGYKAVLIASNLLPKMFPMLMTAAGTILPAKVFVIGAGVAGLQAIATAKRLGAVVQAYDIRPAAKEQVQSLGAKFVELGLESEEAQDRSGYARAMDEDFYRRQRQMMREVVSDSDVVISTAVVPGKRAPVLITEDMVKSMKEGAVIVDLAAERGGNCELSLPGKTVEKFGVKIVAPLNLPSEVPYDASQMYSRNLYNFLNLILKDGGLRIDTEDDIVRETLLLDRGELVNQRIRELVTGGG